MTVTIERGQHITKKITSFKDWITGEFELFMNYCVLPQTKRNETIVHLVRLGWTLDIKKGNGSGVATLLRSITKAEFCEAMNANGIYTQSDVRKRKAFYLSLHSGIGAEYRKSLKKHVKSLKGNISRETLEKSPEVIAEAIIKTRNSGQTLASVVAALDDVKKSTKIFYLIADHQIENRSGIQQTKKAQWRRTKKEFEEAEKDPYGYLVRQVERACARKKSLTSVCSMIPVLILRKRQELITYFGFRNGYLVRQAIDGGTAGGWATEHWSWSKEEWIDFVKKFQIRYGDLSKFEGLKELMASRCVLHEIYPSATSFEWLNEVPATGERVRPRKRPVAA